MKWFITLAALACITGSAAAATGPTTEPDRQALAAAGAATAKRLLTEACSWRAIFIFPRREGARAIISMLRCPLGERIIFTLEIPLGHKERLDIISRDGRWYVTENGTRRKYRPFELPTEGTVFYTALARANPPCIDGQIAAGLGTFECTSDGVATYRRPLPEPLAAQLRAIVAELDASKKQMPASRGSSYLDQQAASTRDWLDHGIPVRVDLKKGIVLNDSSSDLGPEIRDLQFSPEFDERVFRVDDQTWEDCADDPTAGNLGELVTMVHIPPPLRSDDMDARLIDVITGRVRRIPFKGTACLPHCFTKDRKGVIVSGIDADRATRLYMIDLATGDNRRLEAKLPPTAFTSCVRLSPDGRTAAVVQKDAGATLQHRVYVVRLESGEVRPVGNPIDEDDVVWMPDGRRLLFSQSAGPAMDTRRALATMDLEGRVTLLRAGAQPIILPDRQTILFKDWEAGLWKTCDLDGGNVKLFGDGMKGYRHKPGRLT